MTLRARLADGWTPPRSTWKRLVQALRAHKKLTAEKPAVLDGMAGVQAALDRPVRDGADLEPLRHALRAFVQTGEGAPEIDRLLTEVLCAVRAEPVLIQISGWPRGFGLPQRRQLLGVDEQAPVDPVVAAELRQRLDGLALGGSVLAVRVTLGPDEVLPVVPRGQRADLRRGRAGSWLPHVDAVGRFSATPRALAVRQAERLRAVHEGLVVDPFCGCGASAIALAEVGFTVVAIERDSSRARLAARNARDLGVGDRVTVRTGDAAVLLPSVLTPDAAVFLDPPWGAAEGSTRTALTWERLVPRRVADAVGPERTLLAKLPRDFDLATLPDPDRWRIHWELGGPEDGSERTVKMITAVRATS